MIRTVACVAPIRFSCFNCNQLVYRPLFTIFQLLKTWLYNIVINQGVQISWLMFKSLRSCVLEWSSNPSRTVTPSSASKPRCVPTFWTFWRTRASVFSVTSPTCFHGWSVFILWTLRLYWNFQTELVKYPLGRVCVRTTVFIPRTTSILLFPIPRDD